MLTRKHFKVLAEELAEDKLYYKSKILFDEKYNRIVVYCKSINKNFSPDRFYSYMLKHYETKKAELNKRVGGSI